MFEEFSPFIKSENGIYFNAKVIPKSSSNRIGKIGGDNVLRLYVTAVPEKNKANETVIKLLAKSWNLNVSQIIIEKGHRDQNKLIKIIGNSEELMRKLITLI